MVKVDIEASGRDKFEIGMYSLALHSTSFKGCYESHMVRAYGTFKAQLKRGELESEADATTQAGDKFGMSG